MALQFYTNKLPIKTQVGRLVTLIYYFQFICFYTWFVQLYTLFFAF